MSVPHLVIAAFWSTETPDEAADRVADALNGNIVPGTGSVVAGVEVDGNLRRWLRAVRLNGAADFRPSMPREGGR